MKRPKRSLYTIGHSTRTIEEFVELLEAAEIDLVVDVRAIPRSRTNPQFNKETLPKKLRPSGIEYVHLSKLGGRRSRVAEIDSGVNSFWQNRSFHNYADYAMTDDFHEGLSELLELARDHHCAIMCSEAVWWRCHRRIIADHALALGVAVYHLMGKDRIEVAHLTPGAKVASSKSVSYPAKGARSSLRTHSETAAD